MRTDRLQQEFNIQVKLTHFPLHPKTPDEGITLEQLFAGRNVDIAASQARLQKVMQREGLPYGTRTMTYNSRLAQELAAWADDIQSESTIHHHLYQAYFVQGLNLADLDVLASLATQAELPADKIQAVLNDRLYRAQVDSDWNRCRELGISSVPTYQANNQQVVGAQSYEVLQELVLSAGARPRDEQQD